MVMNQQQFKFIASSLIRNEQQIKAVHDVIFKGDTAYETEKRYKRPLNSVGRDVKRVKAKFDEYVTIHGKGCK